MSRTAPHYLLLSETDSPDGPGCRGGRWRFVLEQVDGSQRIEVADHEPQVQGERLQLLSIVRGLEALDQPSRVTLVTSNPSIGRGIRQSLPAWRDNDWFWERFGMMMPVKNCDLWQRIDRAMQVHQVDCRVWRPQQPQPNQQSETRVLERRCIPFKLADKNRRRPRRWLHTSAAQRWNSLSRLIADKVSRLGFQRAYGCA